MMRKYCSIVLAVAMSLAAAQTEARVRRAPASPEQYLQACQTSCRIAEDRCRARRCEGLAGVMCWADCTQKKWACDSSCSNAVARPQQPQPTPQPRQSDSTADWQRRVQEFDRASRDLHVSVCKSGCSTSLFGCESSCRTRPTAFEQNSCMNLCRAEQSSCEINCR